MRISPAQVVKRPFRPRLSPDIVAHYRRLNIAFATAEVICEKGYGATTIGGIVSRAEVARTTFYEHFPNKAACVDWACEEAHRRMFGAIEEASTTAEPWQERLDLAMGTLLERVAADPALSELYLIHSLALVDRGSPHRQAGVDALAELLDQGREANAGIEVSPLVAELIAGGILSMVADCLMRDEAELLTTMHGELVELAVRPFLEEVSAPAD